MLCSGAYHWSQRLFHFKRNHAFVSFFRKHFTLPATFNGRHAEAQTLFGIQYNVIPVRWQTLVLIGFAILNLIFMFAGIDAFGYTTAAQTVTQRAMYRRLMALRSGIIAAVLCVPLYLFASRNNILMLISGWDFQTFNVFHRWVGRWMMIHAAVHGIAFSFQYTINGGHSNYVQLIWQDFDIEMGTIAGLIGGIMCLLAFYPLRHYFYETFLLLHVGIAIAFTYMAWYHCVSFGYPEYMYCMVALWCFDYAVRIVRILYSGPFIKAHVKAEGNSIVIRIKPTLHWAPRPGQYAYIYLMRYKFWESHPFSVIENKDGSYIFVAQAQHGMTRYLHNRVSKMPNKEGDISILLEGWYGEQYPIRKYDTVLLIAGGVGITAMACAALDLNKHTRNGQHVILVWVVRGQENLKWAYDQIDQLCATGHVDVRIYARGCESPVKEKHFDPDSTEDDQSENSEYWKGASIDYKERPVIQELIHTTIMEAPTNVAVVACGPSTLADECRQAVVADVKNGNGYVDYFEDVYTWA
ncbi:ferric reductase like transmembrane component-domain-containing protein [Lipomyces oligophaga]|uniref:ferric reductase like transmembrane component-domain-containing protein n=1 Tax=Lipomyces oligophaga TaxID=45792 RepID=UPI0034CD7311